MHNGDSRSRKVTISQDGIIHTEEIIDIEETLMSITYSQSQDDVIQLISVRTCARCYRPLPDDEEICYRCSDKFALRDRSKLAVQFQRAKVCPFCLSTVPEDTFLLLTDLVNHLAEEHATILADHYVQWARLVLPQEE